MNHKELILDYMERHGSITPLEAQRELGCMRLGARIWDLRHEGYDIIKESVKVPTRGGKWAVVARYRLAA